MSSRGVGRVLKQFHGMAKGAVPLALTGGGIIGGARRGKLGKHM
jgi:hypothetical protein